MTIYNAAPWLRQAVDSLVAQTFRNWELVAVENGSTDASPAILASYGTDPRMRVFSMRENMGRTPGLRLAFEQARGEYIAVLDADDVADPTRFAKQVAFLDEHPATTVVGCWARRIDGEGREIGLWSPPTDPAALYDQLGYENPIVHSAAMYRAAAAAEVGGYPAEVPYAQDCGLWLRLAERGPLGMIGEYLCSHRTIPGGMTRSPQLRVMVSRDNLALLNYAAQHLALSPGARRRSREERTIARVRYAVALARAGRLAAGLVALTKAVIWNPPGILWNRVYRAALFR
jgi:glycosyltransferase involved in cell wall biosynthesis